MAATNGFDWFTGLAAIAAPCPSALYENGGLAVFFAAPNRADYGQRLPRVLMHECMHCFQLAGSNWLQRLVAEEWSRVLELERTGVAPELGPLRRSYGRADQGMPFSVRDLVECLARYWDMHVRGPDRVLSEETFLDPQGSIAAMRAARQLRTDIPYTSAEYDAAMRAGAEADTYPRPYLLLQRAALDSPAVKWLGRDDPARNPNRASWAVNLLLPMVGFVALNTAEPVRAFVAGIDAVLGDEYGLHLETAAANYAGLIELDQLACWGPIVERIVRVLAAEGIPMRASLGGPVELEGWREHPVWRFMPARFDALRTGLSAMLKHQGDAEDPRRPWLPLLRELLAMVLRNHAFAALGLMGIPALRQQLGVAFAPPMLRFEDYDIMAPSVAANFAPWPVTAAELRMAVDEATLRHRALRDADVAAKFGLSPRQHFGHAAAA